MTKYILDSGDPNEYKQISELAKQNGYLLWGSTTNPSLIAKKLNGEKASFEEAFSVLQKQIVLEIATLVPGAVSAEVYASHDTTADQMIAQGREIVTWGDRIVVKLPTTLEGFKARTELRKLGICINNTLVFSQQQVFAIELHEKIMINEFGKPHSEWPCFISPFVGRLDDIGQDGMSLIKNSLSVTKKYFDVNNTWMLEASVRTVDHMKKGVDMDVDLITAPAKIYEQWFTMKPEDQQQVTAQATSLQQIDLWEPSSELLSITTYDEFMRALETKTLDITHPLTDKGIDRFVADWSTIIR